MCEQPNYRAVFAACAACSNVYVLLVLKAYMQLAMQRVIGRSEVSVCAHTIIEVLSMVCIPIPNSYPVSVRYCICLRHFCQRFIPIDRAVIDS